MKSKQNNNTTGHVAISWIVWLPQPCCCCDCLAISVILLCILIVDDWLYWILWKWFVIAFEVVSSVVVADETQWTDQTEVRFGWLWHYPVTALVVAFVFAIDLAVIMTSFVWSNRSIIYRYVHATSTTVSSNEFQWYCFWCLLLKYKTQHAFITQVSRFRFNIEPGSRQVSGCSFYSSGRNQALGDEWNDEWKSMTMKVTITYQPFFLN